MVSAEVSITVNNVLVTEQIASLKESVASMVTGGIRQALTVKLDQALKLLANEKEDKSVEAVQVLDGFIGQAQDLRDEGKLTEAQAAELITAAEETILNIMSSR